MKISILKLLFAAVGLAAVLCFATPASQAGYYGNAPWCAVVNQGAGNVVWECEYDTIEQCVPNVLAGNRGFCGRNPYYRDWQQPPTARHHYQRHHLGD